MSLENILRATHTSEKSEVIKDFISKLKVDAMSLEIRDECLLCPHCLKPIKIVTEWVGICPQCAGRFGVKIILERFEEWAGNEDDEIF